MTAALSTLDKLNLAPIGPVVGEPHTATSYRTDLGQLTENITFLLNRAAELRGTPQKITSADATADSFTLVGHGFSEDDPVRIASVGGSVPTGLLAARVYYIVFVDVDTFKLSASAAGGAINITNVGSGDLYIYDVPDAAASLMLAAGDIGGSVFGYARAAGTLEQWFSDCMSIFGGVFGGEVTYTAAQKRVGADARSEVRVLDLTASDANQNITVATDIVFLAAPAAQREVYLYDTSSPVPASSEIIELRRPASGANSIIIHREGEAGAICTLAGSTCCSARCIFQDGQWRLLSYTAGVTPGADAG